MEEEHADGTVAGLVEREEVGQGVLGQGFSTVQGEW